jgi:hypothetical protein
MADRPPLSSYSSHASSAADPFADRPPRQTHFAEPHGPYSQGSSPSLRPYESTTTVQEFGMNEPYHNDDEYIEKQPLNAGEFAGGFYPPGSVVVFLSPSNTANIVLAPLTPVATVNPMVAQVQSCLDLPTPQSMLGVVARLSSAG